MLYALRNTSHTTYSGGFILFEQRPRVTDIGKWLRLVFAIVLTSLSAVAQNSPAGRQQVLVSPFEAGVTHVGGRYGFTNGNFLVEGASLARQMGSPSIFIYLSPSFRANYPDRGQHLWPTQNPTSLVQLAQTAPFQTVLKMPFRTFVITTLSFANADHVKQFATDPNAAATEEQEFYQLTKYLYSAFAGSGKTFILKNWEGDWVGLEGDDTHADDSPTMINAMTNWMIARQKGVSRARNEAANARGVAVLNAVEVNRIFDYSERGLRRVINKVVPFVQTDMVTYSSYDSTLRGSDATSQATAINQALNVIKGLAPDPLALGSRRLLISEYGLFENERPTETTWRTQTILKTARSAGLLGAFDWQIFDNECYDAWDNIFPAASKVNTAIRPASSQCRGLWLRLPTGTNSSVVSLLAPYWSNTSGPAAPAAFSNGVTVLSPHSSATVPTNVRIVASAKSNYSITSMAIYVDNALSSKIRGGSVDQYVTVTPGPHYIVVQAWDSTGRVFKTPINIKANLVPLTGLVPVLTVTPKTGLPPLTVSASTAQSLGPVSASKIDFGDGTVVNASTGTHTYSAKGNFRITATVTDSLGNSKTTAATVSATPPLPPPPSPGSVVTIYSPTSSQSGSPIHVIADTSSSASTVAMVVYLDNSPVFTTAGRNLDTFVNTGSGTHVVMVQAWGRPNAGDQLSCLASARTSVTVP